MRLTMELDREDDGQVIAEVLEIPGVIVYGSTEEEALRNARVAALKAIADALEHGEAIAGEADPFSITFIRP